MTLAASEWAAQQWAQTDLGDQRRTQRVVEIGAKMAARPDASLPNQMEFDCKMVPTEHDAFGVYITYQNSTTAVRISYEPREGGVFVLLWRLIDGKLPPYAIPNVFDIHDLIALRAPSLTVAQQSKEIDVSTPAKLEKILQLYAEALRLCAADVLRGDFQVFLELAKIVEKRAEQYKLKRYRK